MTAGIPHIVTDCILPLAGSRFGGPAGEPMAQPLQGIPALLIGLFLIIVVPAALYLSFKIAGYIRRRREKELVEEMKHSAAKHEKAGQFVSAGLIYEKLKEPEKAADLFERGGDYSRASEIYETLGEIGKAKEMLEKAGDSGLAAALCMKTGDFIRAARLYNGMGDKAGAARALEFSGNRLAAVRAYREAGDYLKSAQLLKEEGMYKEAAEMYGISLVGDEADGSNLDRFYAYASLLESAEETEKAADIYGRIAATDPDYRDASEKKRALSPAPPPEAEKPQPSFAPPEEPSRGRALKNLISPRMEPRYGFRLWVQILKALDKRRKEGAAFENISPECIMIDSGNNVAFSEDGPKLFSYLSPEAISGCPPDETSLIYSMGVILFEMLAGDLDSLGLKKPGEIKNDIPGWLDELTMKCAEKERDLRYQRFEEIFAALQTLKNRT